MGAAMNCNNSEIVIRGVAGRRRIGGQRGRYLHAIVLPELAPGEPSAMLASTA